MKRIGLLISTLNSGGAERVVSHLSRILGKNYDVNVILFEDTYLEYEVAGRCHNLDIPAREGTILSKLGSLVKRVKRLRGLKRTEKLDCVISFLDSPNFVNILSGVPECRKIISIRNYSDLENKTSLLGRMTDFAMKAVYRHADHVVTVSEEIRQDFCHNYGIAEEKISTIYNPYDFDMMEEKAAEPLGPEEECFLRDCFTFINVGRIMYQKGIWHLLKAFSLVYSENKNTRLVLVGEDYSGGQVQMLIRELGLNGAVLMTGRVKNPYKYLARADAYVLTSLFEGFPNAMVEGMACGCAVIAADCKSGPREILYETIDLEAKISEMTEADYGVLIPELESEENWDAAMITEGEKKVAAAMLKLLADQEVLKKHSEFGLQRSKAFGYDRVRDAFEKVIEGE